MKRHMHYFLDTEFYEQGPHKPIQLISLGLVSETGRELYIENMDVDLEGLSPWLKDNVVPHLTGRWIRQLKDLKEHPIQSQQTALLHYNSIGGQLLSFIGDGTPTFWGYFADYDWVIFCQLFGSMMDLPKRFPQFCFDLKQLAEHKGIPYTAFPKQEGIVHHALADARWNLDLYKFLKEQ